MNAQPFELKLDQCAIRRGIVSSRDIAIGGGGVCVYRFRFEQLASQRRLSQHRGLLFDAVDRPGFTLQIQLKGSIDRLPVVRLSL